MAFEDVGAAAAPVYRPSELLDDPQVKAMDLIAGVEDDDLGSIRMQSVMWRMDHTPGRIRSTGRPLGGDSEAVLQDVVGLSLARIGAFREKGIVT